MDLQFSFMLALSITKKYSSIDSSILDVCDLIEMRLDLIGDYNLEWIKEFVEKVNKPWILTIRKKTQGGNFSNSEKLRLQLLEKFLSLQPNYVDVEYDVPIHWVKKVKKNHPRIHFIRSFHDFQKTPFDIETFFSSKFFHPLFSIHKMAFHAKNSLDTLKMMRFLKKYGKKYPLSLVAMGFFGTSLRAIGPILNNAIDYAAIDSEQSLSAQLSVEELIQIYRYKKQTKNTKIFALIGSPIEHSIGHIFHNRFFEKKNLDAVYVKLPLIEEEPPEFFELIKDLPFAGLSVTTPLKQSVGPYCLDALNQPINTLKKDNEQWIGKNTDGEAVLLLLKRLKKKKILLLGAGAAAMAIYTALRKENEKIDVFNRTYSRAKQTFLQANTIFKALHQIPVSSYDVIINAASFMAEWEEIPLQEIHNQCVVIDINYQKDTTSFLVSAKKRGRKIVDGKEFFRKQALLQQKFWQKVKKK